jgi:hypothetical protein
MQPNRSDTAAGLTGEEARRRFLEFGANDPVLSGRTSGLTQILLLFVNPLAIIPAHSQRDLGGVIFIIRTAGNPLRSRPGFPLTITTIAVVMAGIVIPFTSLGKILGFVHLPLAFFFFLAGASVTYLLLVELVKRKLMRRLLA